MKGGYLNVPALLLLSFGMTNFLTVPTASSSHMGAGKEGGAGGMEFGRRSSHKKTVETFW
jgi:hypothetical protein